MTELKPCPFCGGEATVQFVKAAYVKKEFHGRFVFAGCTKCHIATPLFNANNKTGSPLRNKAGEENAKAKAIEAWNRRAGERE